MRPFFLPPLQEMSRLPARQFFRFCTNNLWLVWPLVLVCAWLAYRPGLTGTFLFDDFVNLPALGATGPVDNFATLWRYLTSGTADPTGRPLSLLSFLLDAQDWPADPAPFLRTNILLHLANGTLLFVLLQSLGKFLGPVDIRNTAAALLGAGAWLLHPLLVSTTLYIVQREAMLPAFFILAGLLLYSHGRATFSRSQGRSGFAWMVVGLTFGTTLATLSKANGILLPVLVLTLEWTIFCASDSTLQRLPRARFARFKAIFLVVPAVLIGTYLFKYLLAWNQTPGMRPWTIGQRILTEPRVILDYLTLLFVPRSVSTGLYNDNYTVSQSLLAPPATLVAALILIAMLGLAVGFRRRAPVFSASVLFYFAGHLLESTTLPLEIYFEHRNYLPALLLFWPLSRAVSYSARPAFLRAAVGVGILALLALTTYQRSEIWGRPDVLSALWASRNPESSRSQATAAADEMARGQPALAAARLLPIWQENPHDLQIALNYINAACALDGLSSSDKARLAKTLEFANIGTLLVRQWLEKALEVADSNSCPGLTIDAFERFLQAAQRNPAINTPLAREKSMPPLLAMLALKKGDPDKALHYLNRALAANLSPETAAGQVSLLASHGHFQQALQHLDIYEATKHKQSSPPSGMPTLHAIVLARQNYWPNELEILRGKLTNEIKASQAEPRPSH